MLKVFFRHSLPFSFLKYTVQFRTRPERHLSTTCGEFVLGFASGSEDFGAVG